MSMRVAAISSSASVAAVKAAGLHVDRHRQVAAEAARHERRGGRRRHRRPQAPGSLRRRHADGTTRQPMRSPARSGTRTSRRRGSCAGTSQGSRLRVRVLAVARQAVEVRAVEGGKGLELLERPGGLEGLARTARCRRARRRCRRSRRRSPWRRAPCGALSVPRNRRGVPPATASSSAARCALGLEHRQAVVVRAHAAGEQRVAVQQQVLRGDGGGDPGARAEHELQCRLGGDVLEHDAQARVALGERLPAPPR